MKLIEILPENLVFPELRATTQAEFIRELCAAIVHELPHLQQEEIVSTLLEREKLGSTGIGEGVAIPHGKLTKLDHLIACFAKSEQGVDFQAIDAAPSHLFFVLLAPQHSAGLHLKALARISRLLKNTAFRNKLMQAHERQALYQIITDEDNQ